MKFTFSLKYEQEPPREGAFLAEGWAGAKAWSWESAGGRVPCGQSVRTGEVGQEQVRTSTPQTMEGSC